VRRLACATVLLCALFTGCSLQTTGALKGNLHLQARFSDVGDLVSGEAVDVGDVQVGSVTNIHLDRYTAVVTLAIESHQKLPTGTMAVLSQTTLLGEPYVRLQLPANADLTHGPWMKTGDNIPTSATPSIEVFTGEAANIVGALASGDLSSALQALSQGLDGRGPELHQVIVDLTQVAAAVASQQANLGTIIDSSGKLGASLAGGSAQIGVLVDDLAAATTTLAANRLKLIASLTQLTRLAGDLNSEVINPHLAQIEQLIANLSPILSETAQAKTSVEGLVTGLKTFVLALPKAISGGQILLNVWVAGLVHDGGATNPFTPSSPSLSSLLAPPQ
jgi:phospholipid/cholesterol/gamma-HCH transport system substrate-binding protein